MTQGTDNPSPPSPPQAGGAGPLGPGPVGPGGVAASNDPPAEQLPRQFGKYMLMRKLASGGMAELFLALHRSVAGFEKLVVIKRILPQMNQDKQFIDMLLHEARIAATLSHPNVVQTFDVGQVDGTYFIAMEHIHGEDIRTIVRQMKKKSVSEFPLEHALTIVIGLCAGLAYAHEKRDLEGKLLGIVHRDISPQNIVVTFSGDVKIVDFGVAKSQHAIEDNSKGGHLKGKVPYMSPEQASGEEIDSRSDVFAAGVILFELTTGKRLFKGANEYETLKLICDSEYPLPSDVAPNYPVQLERIVNKALAKNRDARYQSAREMQADLEAFVRQERLPVSAVSTLAWMEKLFAEKLDEEKADLQSIKLLADQLAAQFPLQDFAPGSTGSHPNAVFDQTGGSLAGTQQKKGSAGLVMGAAALLVAALGVGYFALRTPPVADRPAEAQSSEAPPPPAPEAKGALKVTSEPPGAAIWINGDLRKEVTPATIENLPIGVDIQLKLSADGFESFKQTVRFDKSEEKAVAAKMDTGSALVELDVQPEPVVWVDSKPWKGSVKKVTGLSAEEEHKITVGATGYQAKTFTFTPKRGEKLSFKWVLVKLTAEQLAQQEKDKKNGGDDPKPNATSTGGGGGTGTVRVNAKGGFCNVSVNGAALGPTTVVATAPAGNVRVTCKPESGPAQSQTVKVDGGGTARVTFVVQ